MAPARCGGTAGDGAARARAERTLGKQSAWGWACRPGGGGGAARDPRGGGDGPVASAERRKRHAPAARHWLAARRGWGRAATGRAGNAAGGVLEVLGRDQG